VSNKQTSQADAIEAEMIATRNNLASTVDTLQDKLKPENLVKSGINKGVTAVKDFYVDGNGKVRVERVAATAAAVGGLLLMRRGLKSWSNKRAMNAMPDVMWVPVPKGLVPAPLQAIARLAND
jgi:hypothetical protein